MSEQHEIFDIHELDTVTAECPACKTEIVFHLDTPTTFGAPATCPTCHETYVELGDFLASYRDLFGRATSLGKKMRVRLRSGQR